MINDDFATKDKTRGNDHPVSNLSPWNLNEKISSQDSKVK
jgi:hypothetical protein